MKVAGTRLGSFVLGFVLLLATGLLTACEPTPPPGCDADPDGPIYAAVGADPAPSTCDPPPPCEGCGGGVGDPHLTTFDGRRYDLQTAAEVVAARSRDRVFEVQWRQEPYPYTDTATITAVAMRIAGTRVMVTAGTSIPRIDGDDVELAEGEAIVLATGVVVHHRQHQIIVVHESSGSAVHVQLDPDALGVLVDPPDAAEGLMEGLLGDDDGDPANDVVLADGQVLREPTWEDLHPGLAEAWRVRAETTLFDYADGEGPDTYWDPTFPEREPSLDDFSEAEQAEAERVCRLAGVSDPGLLESCIFDVLVTGDPSIAEIYAQQQQAVGLALEPVEDHGSDDADGGEPADDDEPTSEGTGAALIVDGLWLEETAWLPHVAGDGLVLVRAEDQDEAGVLLAVDTATREIRWTATDIDVGTRPVVVDGVGVVARLASGSDSLGEDLHALVLLSSQDGTELARHVLEDPAGGGLIGDGGTTIVWQGGSTLHAFTVGSDLTPTWSRELNSGTAAATAIVVEDHVLVWEAQVDQVATIAALDLETGDTTSSIEVPGAYVDRISPAGDGTVAVMLEDSMAVVTSSAGLLDLRWVRDEHDQPEDPYVPEYVVRTGDLLVGWTKFVNDGGGRTHGLVAYDVGTGEVVWTYGSAGFDNNAGMLAASDEFVVTGSMGGAWLEIVAVDDGSRVALISPAPSGNGGASNKFTALADGSFMVTSTLASGIEVAFVDPEAARETETT